MTPVSAIYKFPLAGPGEFELTLPAPRAFTHVGLDHEGTPCLWAVVDPKVQPEPFRFYLAEDGKLLPGGLEMDYVGSYTVRTFTETKTVKGKPQAFVTSGYTRHLYRLYTP